MPLLPATEVAGFFEHFFRNLPLIPQLKLWVFGDFKITIPRLYSLGSTLAKLSKNKARVPLRIDGKQSGETTLGNIFSDYAARLANRTEELEEFPKDLHALKPHFRNDVLSDYVYKLVHALSVEANIANDVRHHFRTELGELAHKSFGEDRVGSSTMPHKMNTAEYEQIVSLWKVYMPNVTSAIIAQVSEHQGDSTNRFLPLSAYETTLALSYATRNLDKSLRNLKIVRRKDL